MQQIDEQERRLAAALTRIATAAAGLGPLRAELPLAAPGPAGDDAEDDAHAALRHALAEAQARAEALDQEMAILRERQVSTVATLEARIAALTQQIDAQGVESQRLRMVNVQLREALRGLREALSDGAADSGQINRALQAEVESMRSTRQIEAAELETLLSALEPHVARAEAERAAAPSETESSDA